MSPGKLLLAAAVSTLMSAGLASRRFSNAWLLLLAVGTASALGASLLVLVSGSAWEYRSVLAVGGEPLHWRFDALSAVFLALVAVVGFLAAAYGREYWSDEAHRESASRGRAWWSVFLVSMGAVLTASNGLHFLVAWEAFAIAGYFLITLERRRREVRSAGWLYLVASHVGTLFLVGFFALLASRTGGWDLGPVRDVAATAPLFWLAVVGFGLKAGFFPLHIWLPPAHASAPSHVSAIMSGVAIKMGLYGIIRFAGWLSLPPSAGSVLLLVGAASALLGIVFAFAQGDLKRLLAYCSVENVGIILTGVGAALVAASNGAPEWGGLALAGALMHVWNHGAFKSLLFFGAGSVLHATETRELNRLGGLWRALPWTATTFGIGALAVAGLPPLNGFVSEWLVYLGLVDGSLARGPASWAPGAAAIALATAGALTMASFVKASTLIFLGAPRGKRTATAHEGGRWMRWPMAALAGFCVALGVLPTMTWPLIARAAASWGPLATTAEAPHELALLGAMQLGVLLLAAGLVALLWRRVSINGTVRRPTWDCGYREPTRRMQYTAGSFAGIVSDWFGWLLQPRALIERPRGLFPQRALLVERVPDTVLDRILGPTGAWFEQLSDASRRLQHGGLQLYVAYVFAALTLIGTVVLVGG